MWPSRTSRRASCRQAVRVAADFEESGADAFGRERVKDLWRVVCVGTVVEGQDHLVVGERDRARIGLQADLEAALRSDRDDAGRAERVGPAIGRAPRRAAAPR